MKINNKKSFTNSKMRYSDQAEYYLNHLEKQKSARRDRFSILGRHHNNLDSFIRKEVLSFPAKSKILDAGCGLSSWLTPYLRKKYKIYGVDGEPEVIQICKYLYPKAKYKVGNLYNLDYKDNQFNAIIMREVIEHFKKPETAVKEVNRILKPGGLYILTTPNYSNLLVHVIEHTYNRFFGGACKPYKDGVHPSKFTPHTLTSLILKYFTIEMLDLIDFGISQVCIARKR